MYINKKDATDFLDDLRENLLVEIHSKNDLLSSISKESDWSIIIKSHTIIEAIVTDLIIAQINDNKIRPIVERLPLHDEQIGKLEIIKIYELLPKNQLIFLRKLSEPRNMLVHKYENIDFNFSDYISELDKNKLKAYKRTFTWYAEDDKTRENLELFFMKHPAIALWLSVVMFVMLNVINKEELIAHNNTVKLASNTSNALCKIIMNNYERM